MIFAIWIFTALLLGLWSLAAWGLHAVVTHGVQWIAELKPLLQRLPFGELIERWMPGWVEGMELLLDLVQSALGWLGGAAPALGWMVWVAWGVGALLLLLGALLLSGVVVLLRKSGATTPAATAA